MSEEKNILEETASTVAEKVRKTRRNYHKKENYKQEEGTKTKIIEKNLKNMKRNV